MVAARGGLIPAMMRSELKTGSKFPRPYEYREGIGDRGEIRRDWEKACGKKAGLGLNRAFRLFVNTPATNTA